MTDVFVAATGCELPPRQKVAEAIVRGLINPRANISGSGITAACAAPDPTRPATDMAVAALGCALDATDLAPTDINRLFHASSFDGAQMRVWSPAAYVQSAFGPTRAPAMGVGATCAGGMAAFELAVMATSARRETVAVTTSDLWAAPLINRWHTMPAFALGDGAGSVILSDSPLHGWARVVSCESCGDSSLEAGARTPLPFTLGDSTLIDFRKRKNAFLLTMPREEFDQRRDAGLIAAVDATLTAAERTAASIDFVIPSFLGREMTEREFTKPLAQLGFSADQLEAVREIGSSIGHVGAGDPFIALDLLRLQGSLTRGKSVLVLGVGGGYLWIAAVLDILR